MQSSTPPVLILCVLCLQHMRLLGWRHVYQHPVVPLFPASNTHFCLQAAHGDEGASELTPLSFALPEELDQWVGWLRSQQQEQEQGRQQQQRRGRQGQAQESGQVQRQQGSDRPTSHITQAASGGQIQQGVQQQSAVSDTGQASGGAGGRESWGKQLWMLKTGQDAGKGLRLMTAAEALDYASQPSTWYKGRRRKEQLQVGGPTLVLALIGTNRLCLTVRGDLTLGTS
jgi:hypothetical protein